MKQICLLFTIIILGVQPTDAMFRYTEKQQVVHQTNHYARKYLQTYQRIDASLSAPDTTSFI